MLVTLKFQLILSKSQEIAFPQIDYVFFWNTMVDVGTVCVNMLLNELPFNWKVLIHIVDSLLETDLITTQDKK